MSQAVPDPDDFFADTRMSFGDHIEDLRSHLWRAVKGFILAMIVSFFFGKAVLEYITKPVKEQLRVYHNNRVHETLKDLEKEPDEHSNLPTGFVPYYISKDQIDAILKGQPPEVVNAMPRPVLVGPNAPKGEDKSLWERWFGSGDKNDEDRPGEKKITSLDDQYKVYLSVAEPLRQMALMNEALRKVGDFDSLATLRVEEAFMVWFKVCIMCGLVLGSPWIFYQVWAFVAAGLYPHEKRLVHVYLPVSLGLFLAGVFMCEIFVIPKAIEALLWFNDWMGFKPDLRLNEWLGFAIFMPVIFGLSFQTPLVMLFLAKLGIVTADTFRNKRRLAWFLMAVFAAVITPSTDAFSMLFLWVPMSLLFELGIFLIKLSPRETEPDVDVPDSDELIEV